VAQSTGFYVTPASLAFSGTAGGPNPATRTVSLTSNSPLLLQVFYAAATTVSGGNWLSVTPTSQFTPETLFVKVDTAGMAAGSYAGQINITAPNLAPVTIPVALTVEASQAARFILSPASLTFTGAAGGASPAAQTVSLTCNSPLLLQVFYATATTSSGGNWLSVTPASQYAPEVLTVKVASAGMAAGTYWGQITITAPNAVTAVIAVQLVLAAGQLPTPGSLTASPSSLLFSHPAGSGAASSQAVAISASGGAGVYVIATPTRNWITVSATGVTTPFTLYVNISTAGLGAGEHSGAITITAPGYNSQSIGVRLVATAPAGPTVSAVLHAATAQPTAAAPGLMISLYGTNLGPAAGVAGRITGGVLETAVSGTRVLFDGVPAPLLYVQANQINAIVPFSVAGKASTAVQLERDGITYPMLTMDVHDSAPGVFTSNNRGYGQGSILNQDYTVNGPYSPAARGSVVMIFATGGGQTSPPGIDGAVASAGVFPSLVLPVRVYIDGRSAEVLYAGPLPGSVAGSLQINARVPMAISTPSATVVITIGGRASRDAVTMAVY
jgi:uncharacterized protein (TIGR03437 family)